MPAMHFYVTWPDGSQNCCYSPSTVISEYLQPGGSYKISQFAELSEKALLKASDRVQQKYGYHCSSAMDQLAQIRQKISLFDGAEQRPVVVTKIIPA